jgi:myo-inositol-1(or 4)-monophosphatase
LTPTLTGLNDALHALLVEAGQAALRRFRNAPVRWKADGTEVTDADRESEAVLVAGIERLWPEAGIVSEEGARRESSDVRGDVWYLDPIDGTSAFLDGLAHWGPTVCLVRDGELTAGALWFPRLNEFWYAERGAGAWRDGQRLAPADPGPPGRHHSLYLPSRYHRRMPFAWPGKVRALGSSAAHLAQVAAGGGVGTIIPSWQLWDVGCGILLIEEAGRVVIGLDGGSVDPLATPGQPFVAGAPTAAASLLASIQLTRARTDA